MFSCLEYLLNILLRILIMFKDVNLLRILINASTEKLHFENTTVYKIKVIILDNNAIKIKIKNIEVFFLLILNDYNQNLSRKAIKQVLDARMSFILIQFTMKMISYLYDKMIALVMQYPVCSVVSILH